MAEDMMRDELHADIVENEEVVEEAHDPENATQQSIDSVEKVADATKKSTCPKTKAGLITAMYGKLSKMNKEELKASYQAMMGESVEVDELVMEGVDTSAELAALVDSEATLTEEFKEKTALIFEAALQSKLSEEVGKLEESYQEELAEELAFTKEDMIDKVDSYLNYVVESWMEDNKLAVEAGLRTEIAENFMTKLKDVFVESYVDVPDSKVDMVDELTSQVIELEEKLNETTADAIELSEQVIAMKREAVLAEASKDMAQTQIEKLKGLAESVDFEDEDTFAGKVATIKESFFGKVEATPSQVELAEAVEPEESFEDVQQVSASMAQYLKALKQ